MTSHTPTAHARAALALVAVALSLSLPMSATAASAVSPAAVRPVVALVSAAPTTAVEPTVPSRAEGLWAFGGVTVLVGATLLVAVKTAQARRSAR